MNSTQMFQLRKEIADYAFMYGGIMLVIGVIIGFVVASTLPKISPFIDSLIEKWKGE